VSAITGQDVRRVLGHLPTGVTIITAFGPEGPIGMSANSVTSVSLDPPLVLFCPANTSQTWPAIRAANHFCINILAGHHEDLCRRFSLRGVERFAGVTWQPGRRAPWLDDAVAWIGCTLHSEHPAGDHSIVTASLNEIEATSGVDPLVFFRGAYGTFQSAIEAEAVDGDAATGELPKSRVASALDAPDDAQKLF
jgi:flavin reductase (DIM6/NTAB) family NADH-FMN oxidoreductase RutF